MLLRVFCHAHGNKLILLLGGVRQRRGHIREATETPKWPCRSRQPGLVLLFATGDLRRNGSLPSWNGWVRMIFVVCTFALSFGDSTGRFVSFLALGDLPFALGAIFGLPYVLQCSHVELLLNR
jgi:hypothetical protein